MITKAKFLQRAPPKHQYPGLKVASVKALLLNAITARQTCMVKKYLIFNLSHLFNVDNKFGLAKLSMLDRRDAPLH